MKTPVFKYSNVWFAASAVLTIPLLIDMCTACHLFSLWIAWLLFFLICLISIVRLVHAFAQHLYKFAWGLIGQLLLGAAVLIFFQLSYNRVIETPVSNPLTPAVVNIADPLVKPDTLRRDSLKTDSLRKIEEERKEKKEELKEKESLSGKTHASEIKHRSKNRKYN